MDLAKEYDDKKGRKHHDDGCKPCDKKGKDHEDKHKPAKELNYNLTDSFIVPHTLDFSQLTVSISENGKLVFVGNLQSILAPTDAAAVLYRNEDGRLIQSAIIPGDPALPNVESAAASLDFKRFITADDAGGDVATLHLYRLQNGQFEALATASLTNFLSFTFGLNFGPFPFSRDNKYVAVAHINGTDVANNVLSRLSVFNADTLELVAFLDEQVGFPNIGPSFFSLLDKCGKERRFIVAGFVANHIEEDSSLTEVAPSYVRVYELRKGKLHVVATDLLPSPVRGVTPFVYGREKDRILIAVTGARATLPGEPSVFINPALPLIPGDDKNVRIYEFDGHDLNLVYREHVDGSVSSPAWYPDGRFLAWGQVVGGSRDPGFVGVATVTRRLKVDDCRLKLVCGSPDVLPSPSLALGEVFSANGKWFLVGGTDTGVEGVNDLALYRVKAE